MRIFSHWGPYMKNWWLFFSLVINLSALLWGLTALKFSFTWVRRKAPPGPPKYEKTVLFYHILGLNLKMSYQIASLFHMYIDMGERIAGKQDRFSLIIEGPQKYPKIYIFLTFWPINEKMVFKLFPLVVHMSTLWWGLSLLTFWCPWYPWILCKAQHDPQKN